jgi:hypothetical protein
MRKLALSLFLTACACGSSGCFMATASLVDWTRKRPTGPYYAIERNSGQVDIVVRIRNSQRHEDGWYRLSEGGGLQKVEWKEACKDVVRIERFQRGYFACRSHFVKLTRREPGLGGFLKRTWNRPTIFSPERAFKIGNRYADGVHTDTISRLDRRTGRWHRWGGVRVPLRERPSSGRVAAGCVLSVPTVAVDVVIGGVVALGVLLGGGGTF